MANQITPASLLNAQLYDWNVLLAQLEQNPDTSSADLTYCRAKIEQLEQEINALNQPPYDDLCSWL